jgi:hemoglobin-like flavoprotein
MAISERQKLLVQESFTKVEPIADQAAAIFYAQLFEYDPSLRPLFKADLKDQGKKLMAALKLAVKSLDDLAGLVPVLENMAVKHVGYGVKVDDYTPVGNALIHTLKTGLGDAFTPELRGAWVEVYRTMADVMRGKAYPEFNAATYKNTKSYNIS